MRGALPNAEAILGAQPDVGGIGIQARRLAAPPPPPPHPTWHVLPAATA
jgi:hypothetical protein